MQLSLVNGPAILNKIFAYYPLYLYFQYESKPVIFQQELFELRPIRENIYLPITCKLILPNKKIQIILHCIMQYKSCRKVYVIITRQKILEIPSGCNGRIILNNWNVSKLYFKIVSRCNTLN